MINKLHGYETAHSADYSLLERAARQHRRYPTAAEAVLWDVLRGKQLGFRFRRQHPVEGCIPDFVCLPNRLIVEVDGRYHLTEEQLQSDSDRTAYLASHGFRVIRFTNDEVIGNIEQVIKTIKMELNKQSNILQPTSATPSGEVAALKKESIPSPSSTSLPPGTPLLRRGRGRLIIFSAPSGSGKSTIVQWLMQAHPELNLAFSISCTSRAPRGTERDGIEYFFLTPEEFKARIVANEFLEYEEVYENRFYGTLKSQVDTQTEAGQNVVFDVDVKGGVNIKKFYGDRALSLFVQPPSIDELRRRLEGRATDAPEVIEQRLAKAGYELTFAPQFDHVVVNDNLDEAKAETLSLVRTFLGL
ncbi:MAG: guanylate kinase [Prevotella buccae]|uniref:guanylate kinase n=1 Tax=Segatella buccae TaxID=28126 RepID=UPI0024312760|nr:guanylate kinase [Segatella buccae]MBS5896301.1 guanylate kinase [Segatella buccae]